MGVNVLTLNKYMIHSFTSIPELAETCTHYHMNYDLFHKDRTPDCWLASPGLGTMDCDEVARGLPCPMDCDEVARGLPCPMDCDEVARGLDCDVSWVGGFSNASSRRRASCLASSIVARTRNNTLDTQRLPVPTIKVPCALCDSRATGY